MHLYLYKPNYFIYLKPLQLKSSMNLLVYIRQRTTSHRTRGTSLRYFM